jgi:hypothetical protein
MPEVSITISYIGILALSFQAVQAFLPVFLKVIAPIAQKIVEVRAAMTPNNPVMFSPIIV